ncbi:MAG: hypothetical protein ABH823_01720 [bacterium]
MIKKLMPLGILLIFVVAFSLNNCGTIVTVTTTTSTTTTTLLYSLSGVISWESFDNLPIASVEVSIDSTVVATTDALGVYSVSSLEAGAHTLSFSLTGWTFYPNSVSISLESDATRHATAELTNWQIVASAKVFGYDYQSVEQGADSNLVWLTGNLGGAGKLLFSDDGAATFQNISFGQSAYGNWLPAPADEIFVYTAITSQTTIHYLASSGNIRGFDFDNNLWSDSWTATNPLIVHQSFPAECLDGTFYGKGNYVTTDYGLVRAVDSTTYTSANMGFNPLGVTADGSTLYCVGVNGYYNSLPVAGWGTPQKIADVNLNALAFRRDASEHQTDDLWAVGDGAIVYSNSAGAAESWQVDVKGIPVSLYGVDSSGDTATAATTYVCGESGLLLKRR